MSTIVKKSGTPLPPNATDGEVRRQLREWGLENTTSEGLIELMRLLGSNGITVNCDQWCKAISRGLLDPSDWPEDTKPHTMAMTVTIEVTGNKLPILIAKSYLLWKEAFEEWCGHKVANFPGK